ncbi:conserved hypothetical protein [Methanocella paludicola SANAE]|uniref:Metalloenzyme domain-containing protein n=1 Tax=Methanocella paludicola (strain DSM 17711 / JCM 13418 / NBRC 101707 / SANAE) TaxID=304371 RepID=D1Z037_METPS|nr:arylsulfatase [Methanocella paludicola]BAI62059.1 conserved hypothetical protein [Methanocella paludicola SANAE]
MRYLLMLLLAAFIFLSPSACAQGTVIVIIDGLGSSYLQGQPATYASGMPIDAIDMRSFDAADAYYQLKVPVPATEYGHAVIVTGYSNISPEEITYYHATIFDALHDDGYLALGILENGDSREMLGELDIAVREKNHSIYSPDFQFIKNGHGVSSNIGRMMQGYPGLSKIKAGKDPYEPYIRYNSWALGFARDTVDYMYESEQGADYVLIVNAGGLDSAGQNLGYDGYSAVLEGMDQDLMALIETCRRSGTILLITADHGMSFPDSTSRGSHANTMAASRNESLLAPLFFYSNITTNGGGTYGQECLAPTLLSLLDEPNTLSMSDGTPIPVKEKPTLFLMSEWPMNVSITGNDLSINAEVNGTYRASDLEKGDYLIQYDRKQENVHLDHDMTVELRKDGQDTQALPPWMAYGPVTVISVVGIAISLKLVWARR